jgi:hypothetical protein
MDPMTGMMAGSLALGVGSSIMGHNSAKDEAERRAAAIANFQRRQSAIYDRMAKDAWAAGGERQKALGQELAGLPGIMGRAPSAAPDLSSFMPEGAPEGGRDNMAYRQAMASAGQPAQGVNQAILNDQATGLDRNALMRALQQLGFTSGLETQVNAPQHARYQFKQQKNLDEAQAELDAILGGVSNSTRNQQLLSSLMGTAGQGLMMGAMYSGGPSTIPSAPMAVV